MLHWSLRRDFNQRHLRRGLAPGDFGEALGLGGVAGASLGAGFVAIVAAAAALVAPAAMVLVAFHLGVSVVAVPVLVAAG